ncbi:hypothetical protein SDC9_89841 [bioreactor metagenome]|uniref:Uncharacterized protein n=1 Tax=bioreactor metagenome TaxID=1076179 RepID=A0A644ZS04_9ZZZZ
MLDGDISLPEVVGGYFVIEKVDDIPLSSQVVECIFVVVVVVVVVPTGAVAAVFALQAPGRRGGRAAHIIGARELFGLCVSIACRLGQHGVAVLVNGPAISVEIMIYRNGGLYPGVSGVNDLNGIFPCLDGFGQVGLIGGYAEAGVVFIAGYRRGRPGFAHINGLRIIADGTQRYGSGHLDFIVHMGNLKRSRLGRGGILLQIDIQMIGSILIQRHRGSGGVRAIQRVGAAVCFIVGLGRGDGRAMKRGGADRDTGLGALNISAVCQLILAVDQLPAVGAVPIINGIVNRRTRLGGGGVVEVNCVCAADEGNGAVVGGSRIKGIAAKQAGGIGISLVEGPRRGIGAGQSRTGGCGSRVGDGGGGKIVIHRNLRLNGVVIQLQHVGCGGCQQLGQVACRGGIIGIFCGIAGLHCRHAYRAPELSRAVAGIGGLGGVGSGGFILLVELDGIRNRGHRALYRRNLKVQCAQGGDAVGGGIYCSVGVIDELAALIEQLVFSVVKRVGEAGDAVGEVVLAGRFGKALRGGVEAHPVGKGIGIQPIACWPGLGEGLALQVPVQGFIAGVKIAQTAGAVDGNVAGGRRVVRLVEHDELPHGVHHRPGLGDEPDLLYDAFKALVELAAVVGVEATRGNSGQPG